MRLSRRSLVWCQAWDSFIDKEEDVIGEDEVAKEEGVDGARIGIGWAIKVEFNGEEEASVESTGTSSKKCRSVS